MTGDAVAEAEDVAGRRATARVGTFRTILETLLEMVE
jgi:hypothetical protein